MQFSKVSTLAMACVAGGLMFSPASAQQPPQPRPPMGPQQMWLDHMCAMEPGRDHMGAMMQHRAEHMATMLQLTPTHLAALKDIGDTRMKDRTDFKASICANKPDLSTFPARIALMAKMMQHRADTFKVEADKLTAFYNSLDDRQKAAFEEMRMGAMMHGHGPDEMGGPMGGPGMEE
jgi:Spy/CpxP family protein refolding chaperone